MNKFLILSLALLCTAYAANYDYYLLEGTNFWGGDHYDENCPSIEEAINRAPAWINESPMLLITFCNGHVWYKKLPQVILRNSDINGHNSCKSVLYGESLQQDGYFVVRGIDMVGGDETQQQLGNENEVFTSAIAHINGNARKCLTYSKAFFTWKKNLLVTSPNDNFRGNPQLNTVFFGKKLNLNKPRFPESYFYVEGQDFVGGDISNEACDNWDVAVTKAKNFIQRNSRSVVTFVDNRCYFKNLWGVNNQASNDAVNARSRTIMFGEVYQDSYYLVRGLDAAGGDARDENSPNVATSLQRSVPYIGTDPKKITSFSRDHIWYKVLRNTNLNASGNHAWLDTLFYGKAITEIKPNCAYLYSECDYKGNAIEVCNDMPDIPSSFKVKSVIVPKGSTIYLYDLKNYGGATENYSQNTPCIKRD